jgi:hypothetical protein
METPFTLAIFLARHIAKSLRCIYKHRVVARTGEDLHEYLLFADRARASEAGCLHRLLRALCDSIDRVEPPIANTQ